MDTVARAAVERVQQSGIIFIDEIDKVAGREGGHGPDVSREGVQRDILPIVEGTTVNTKYGMVQDRSHPVHRCRRVPRLEAVGPDSGAAGPLPDPRRARGAGPRGFRPHPDRAEERAGQAVHGAALDRGRRPSGSRTAPIGRIADFAALVNDRTENIGARRLHTVMEKLLDEVSFDAPEMTEKNVDDRRGLRRSHARRHRPQRRPFALRAVMSAGRLPEPSPTALVLATLAALRPEGAAARAAAPGAGRGRRSSSVRRSGDDVRAAIRAADGATRTAPGTIELDRVEIYAMTIGPGGRHAAEPRPADEGACRRNHRRAAAACSRVKARYAVQPGAPPDTRPAPGDRVTFVEELTAEKLKPMRRVRPRQSTARRRPASRVPSLGTPDAAAPAISSGSGAAGSGTADPAQPPRPRSGATPSPAAATATAGAWPPLARRDAVSHRPRAAWRCCPRADLCDPRPVNMRAASRGRPRTRDRASLLVPLVDAADRRGRADADRGRGGRRLETAGRRAGPARMLVQRLPRRRAAARRSTRRR